MLFCSEMAGQADKQIDRWTGDWMERMIVKIYRGQDKSMNWDKDIGKSCSLL